MNHIVREIDSCYVLLNIRAYLVSFRGILCDSQSHGFYTSLGLLRYQYNLNRQEPFIPLKFPLTKAARLSRVQWNPSRALPIVLWLKPAGAVPGTPNGGNRARPTI